MTNEEKNLIEYIGNQIQLLNNVLIKIDASFKELCKLVYFRDLERRDKIMKEEKKEMKEVNVIPSPKI